MPAADEWPADLLMALPSAVWNRPKKQSRLRAVFLSPKASLPGNRILGGPCGTVWIGWRHPLSTKRTKARQRGQRIVSRGKRRPARRTESKTGRGESISSAGDSGENRRKSVCGSICTFGFRGQEVPQCLRAVGLEPDSIVGRMHRMQFP